MCLFASIHQSHLVKKISPLYGASPTTRDCHRCGLFFWTGHAPIGREVSFAVACFCQLSYVTFKFIKPVFVLFKLHLLTIQLDFFSLLGGGGDSTYFHIKSHMNYSYFSFLFSYLAYLADFEARFLHHALPGASGPTS